jgi:hypothetical protein
MLSGREPDRRIENGGTVRSHDQNSARVIESKNIVEFKTYCYWYNKDLWRSEPVRFSVSRENGEGPFILTRDDTKVETDESFLAKLQEIIEKHKLVSKNGDYEHTYGIPPEFTDYEIKAVYDSGEELHFITNGGPESPWCADLRKALCDELVRHGIEDMLPPIEDRRIARFDLKFNEWPRNISYGTIRTEDDEDGKRPVHFSKIVFNYETRSSEGLKIITIPDGFYARITELVDQTNLKEYSNGKIDFPDAFGGGGMMMGMVMQTQEQPKIDKEHTPYIGYCCEGESGKQCNTFRYGDDIPEGLKEAAAVIREYLEEVFASQ